MHIVKVFTQQMHTSTPGAGFMNRRRLCQLTAAILTSDLTTHNCVGFMKRHSDYRVTIQRRVDPIGRVSLVASFSF